MASFKSDMDVKLAAALRAQTKSSDENDDKFIFSPLLSIEQIHELEKNLADETYSKRFVSFHFYSILRFRRVRWGNMGQISAFIVLFVFQNQQVQRCPSVGFSFKPAFDHIKPADFDNQGN